MKYLSLFSGIGGFELGIQQAYEELCNNEHAHISEESKQEECTSRREWTSNQREVLLHAGNRTAPLCIGYSEIDKYAIQVYNKQFNHKNYGDITKINEKELPDFDLIVGGFPCQSFSIAGKRGGFEDTRGTLFFDIARIIREKQPSLLLLENVKGLLSHDKGDTFKTIIRTLDELGYDIQWQVLNSKNFGVPQNRERVFIVGHLRGTSRPKVFPFGEGNQQNTMEVKVEGKLRNFGAAPPVLDESGVSSTIVTAMGTGGNNMPCIKQLNKPKHSNDRVYSDKGLSPTLNTMQGGNRQPFIKTGNVENPLKGKTDYGWHCEQNIYDKKGITRTVKAGGGSGNMPKLLDGSKIRRLTPKECERLQGFPDDWTYQGAELVTGEDGKLYKKLINVSDTQRYKMCGNAVTVNVIKEIMLKLI